MSACLGRGLTRWVVHHHHANLGNEGVGVHEGVDVLQTRKMKACAQGGRRGQERREGLQGRHTLKHASRSKRCA